MALCRFPGIARAELSSRKWSERPLHLSVAHGEVAGLGPVQPFAEVLRTPNHDVTVVTMVRSELSSHLVGLP